MLRETLSRSLARYPLASTVRCNTRHICKITFPGRSPSRLITTSSVSRDVNRDNDKPGLAEESSSSSAQAQTNDPNCNQARVPFDFEALRTRFRALSNQSAVTVRRRADEFTAKTASTFSHLGSSLNKMTGYDEIDALKKQVAALEAKLITSRQAARSAKIAYANAVSQRSKAQREHSDLLLQKEKGWSDDEIYRYTNLLKQEKSHNEQEVSTKLTLDKCDEIVDEDFSQLMHAILARYHEEQIWSDKIRSASTYGSLAALGLNLVVFILAIVLVEPWKRRRLAQTFEKKIEEMSIENTAMVEGGMTNLARHFVMQEKLLSEMIEKTTSSSSQNLKATAEGPAHVVEKLAAVTRDREVAAIFAASAILAGTIGWFARSWVV